MIFVLNIIATECPTPVKEPHMKTICTAVSLIIGSKCTYSCDPGYTLIGASERECRSDGYWSHTNPHCQG